jgi:hypothetical protein
MTDKEIFKSIPGYDNYSVGCNGTVINISTGKVLKQHSIARRSSPYSYVFVYNKDGRKQKAVHRLVAEAFIPNPLNLPQINHKDEDSLNNRVENLEWCDSKYNNNYGTKKDRIKERLMEHNYWTGKHHSDTSKEKMRKAKLGKPSKKRKPIVINGIQYESMTDAMKKLNICTRRLYKLIKEGNHV